MKFVIPLLVVLVGLTAVEGFINCTNHAQGGICLPDLKGVCLVNTTLIRGTCDAEIEICEKGAKEATDLGCCTNTTFVACVALFPDNGNGVGFNSPAIVVTIVSILLYFVLGFIAQ